MLYSIDEHEMNLAGIAKPSLDLGTKGSQIELDTRYADFERTVEDYCLRDPMFSSQIDELCQNYTEQELQHAASLYAGDLFSARNDILQFMSINCDQKGEIPTGLVEYYKELQSKLSEAAIYNKMLQIAIEIKHEENFLQEEEE